MNVSAVDVIQLIGAIGVGLFYPMQNWRAFVTRTPTGLSFLAFSMIAVGVAGYLALGIRLQAPIFYGLNGSCLVFVVLLLTLMWLRSVDLCWKERAAGLLILSAGFSGLLAVNFLAKDIAPTVSGWMGFAGIVGFYPLQNGKLFLKRDSTGLSLAAFLALFIGLSSLTVFGMFIADITVILGNGLCALGTLPILWGIIRWKNKKQQAASRLVLFPGHYADLTGSAILCII